MNSPGCWFLGLEDSHRQHTPNLLSEDALPLTFYSKTKSYGCILLPALPPTDTHTPFIPYIGKAHFLWALESSYFHQNAKYTNNYKYGKML